ncbi:MAG: hypothetical protein AUK44_06855 [Porphyromonadaceae bacterium CG2_30_38_12]|nr:MAG: hypothetical protein AUK44_06855 [Porphyromonadaceae bacterium CG2_30_38_12]
MKKIIISSLLTVSLSIFAQVNSLCPVIKISTGRIIHRFFDTSPISPSGKYIALFRFPSETVPPKPGDSGEVVLVNIKTGKEKVLAKSRGFEMQLAANIQWGKSDKELYFNDVDTLSWKGFAVQLNPFTGAARRMEGTVFMVSPDGTKLASYNLEKSRYAQVGYGVVIPNELNQRNKGLVDNDGIYITDVKTGKCRMLISISQLYEQSIPSVKIANPENFEFYCFQVKWNPQGTRLLTVLDWLPKLDGKRQRAVITMRADGTDIRTAITDEQWSKGGHHVNWMPDGEHLSMNLNVDGKPGIEIITVKYDGTNLKTVYPVGSGHPSYHPKGLPFIITDAYSGEMPLADGKTPIRLINVEKQTERNIAEIILPKITNFEFRVDAHPAWDKSGRYVVFNGTDNGTRCVYISDLKKLLKR